MSWMASKATVWQKQQTTSALTLDSMRRERFLTDVTLVCDGVEFPAHRCHLCAASPYFHAMFKSGMQETTNDRVELQNIRKDSMSDILDFVYTGRVPEMMESEMDKLRELIEAADFLGIDSLLNFGLDICRQLIMVDSLLDQWRLAEVYKTEALLERLVKLAAINFRQVSTASDFFNLSLPQLTELLRHPDLRVGPADSTLQAIVRWVQFKKKERATHLTELVSTVNLGRLSLPFLDQLLTTERVFIDDEQLHNLAMAKKLEKEQEPKCNAELVCFWKDEVCAYDLDDHCFPHPPKQLPFNLNINNDFVTAVYEGHIYLAVATTSEPSGETTPTTAAAPPFCRLLYEYSLRDNTMTELHRLQGRGDFGVGMTVINGLIYVVTSESDELGNAERSMVQRVNPLSREGEMLAPTHHVSLASPQLFSFCDQLYAIETLKRDELQAEKYDTRSNQWTVAAKPTVLPRRLFPYARMAVGNVLVRVKSGRDVEFRAYNLLRHESRVIGWTGGPRGLYMWHVNSSCSSEGGGAGGGGAGGYGQASHKPSFLVLDSNSTLHVYSTINDSWETVSDRLSGHFTDFRTLFIRNAS